MRYTLRLMIMLLCLLLVSYNGSGYKADGKLTADNYTFSNGYYLMRAVQPVPEQDSATDRSNDIATGGYNSDTMSDASMQNSIIAAAVYVNSLSAATTAEQLVLQ